MRLAEIVGALSIASDVSTGSAMERNLRATIISYRLARLLDATPIELDATFWNSLLRWVGCTAFGPDVGSIVPDDISVRHTLMYVDPGHMFDAAKRMFRGFAPEASGLQRLVSVAKFATDGALQHTLGTTSCEAGMHFARTLGLSNEVVTALHYGAERFDGKGLYGLRELELPFAHRVADIGDAIEKFWWLDGEALASRVLEERKGGAFDPSMVDVARPAIPKLVAGLRGNTVWDLYLEADPGQRVLDETAIDACCVALGRFADFTSVHTLVHSQRVADLARAAAEAAGLSTDERTLVARAASVHDVGRASVTNGIWDKRGELSTREWQRIREHSHHTDVVLRAARLDTLAEIAGSTHERGRGSGYHKNIALDQLAFLSKLVGAADVMSALGEDRPHRKRLDRDRAIREIRELATRGELDARAVNAVLEVGGEHAKRKRGWPGGLSDREVEVLRLVAIGRTNKEIGTLLDMSPRTAQRHVMNIYERLGLESRAGLALYAVEHGLLDG